MNSTPKDVSVPSHRECLLPAVARMPSVTQVSPAKKITFLKRGDPRFSGVRLAVHQRTFKSFGALMDELSQRVPLSFGVRCVTTPRGLHDLNALEQLEDGGCYLCSDKKPPKISSVSASCEVPGTSSSCKTAKGPRRLLLLKNGDPRFQHTVALSHRNTRTLTAFLSKASALLHFPVKQLYTTSGEKVDSLKSLLHGPSVLVCAGHEPFRPPAVEGGRSNATETSSEQIPRSKNGSWGPKAKRSVIHARPGSESRPRCPSLLSERSALSDPRGPPPQTWLDKQPQDTSVPLGPVVAEDNVEKKVHMNEDGSLSVEMKVRFHFLGEDTLLWSRLVGRSGGEGPVPWEGDPFNHTWEAPTAGASESGPGGLMSFEAGCKKVGDRAQWQPGSMYEIWTNPLYTSQAGCSAIPRGSSLTQSSHSRVPWDQKGVGKKIRQGDSVSLSGDRAPEDSDSRFSCCGGSHEDSTSSCVLHPSQEFVSHTGTSDLSRAGGGPCPGTIGLGGREPLIPVTRDAAGSLSGSSVGANPQQERRDRHRCEKQGQDSLCKTRTVTSWQKVNQGVGPSSPTGSTLRRKDLQVEWSGQDTWHLLSRCGSGAGLTSNNVDSQGTMRECASLSSCHSGSGKRRQWDNRVGAGSSLNTSSLSQGVQEDLLWQHHNLQETHSPLDSPEAGQKPESPSPDGLTPQVSAFPSAARSQMLGTPSSASTYSQDAQGVSSGPLSNSNVASHLYPSNSSSVEAEGDLEFQECSPTPTPSSTSHSVHSQARKLGEQVGGDTLESSRPLGNGGPSCDLVCGKFCPTPPKARSYVMDPPSCSSDHNSGDPEIYRGSGRGHPRDTRRRHSPVSDTGTTTGRAIRATGGFSPFQDPKPERIFQEDVTISGTSPEEQEEIGGVSPGTLPCTSPEAMVREWLSCIPEEPVLMKAEMVDQTLGLLGVDAGGTQEDPAIKCFLGDLEEPAQAIQPSLKGVISEEQEPGGALPMTGDAGPYSEGGFSPSGVADTPQEAGMGKEATMGMEGLPPRASAHARIMKVLLGSKQGRPSSLPEVSNVQVNKLSCSAQALVSCLANLHFFDQDLVSPAGQVRFTDSAHYQELLDIFQTLWLGSKLGLGQPEWCQVPRSLRSHMDTEDLTPTSSSGVDVGSGSGGSGESSGLLVPERMDLPLKIPQLGSDSRVSENHENPGSQSPHGYEDSPNSQMGTPIPHELKAEGGQVIDSDMDQKADTTPDREVQLDKTKEGMEGDDLQVENIKVAEFPEERRNSGQESSRTDCQDREGAQGGGQEEEEGRDPASTMPPGLEVSLTPERKEISPEHHSSLSEKDPSCSRSYSDPHIEANVDKLSGAADLGSELPQTQFSPGISEKSPWRPRRPSLDPDLLWVSRMLKKMEKVFLAHLTESTAELRARWNLQTCELLDQMVSELQQDLSQRLQASTDRELQKIQSRAGARLQVRDLSLQMEQRRHRLQGLRNLLAFSEQSQSWGAPCLSLDDGALGVRLGGEIAGEEFCPCEACVRKKGSPVTRLPTDTMGTASAPITKAFDLQQILQKKGHPKEEKLVEGVSEKRRGREEALLREEEEPTAQRREEASNSPVDSAPKEPEWEKESLHEKKYKEEKSYEVQVSSEAEAVEDGDPSPGGQSDSAQTTEIQEAKDEGSQGLGGSQGENEGSFHTEQGQGLLDEASINSSPGGASSQQRSDQKADLSSSTSSSSTTSSLEDSSQIQQKDSEEPLDGELRSTEEETKNKLHLELKIIYPESLTPESKEGPLGTRVLEQGTDRGSDKEAEKDPKNLEFTETRHENITKDRAEGFDQDDLDF